MKSATLWKVMMVPAILIVLAALVSVAPAAELVETEEEACHGIGWPDCIGVFDVEAFGGTEISYHLKGEPTLAVVEKFRDPSLTRNVTWKNLEMKGATEAGDAITLTLDTSRKSSGTVLSTGDKEFPATATMRFFFKMEVGGVALVSERPAVVQGIIHSVPPSPGDVLTLIEPVEFHEEGEPGVKFGTLQKSSVSFNNPKH